MKTLESGERNIKRHLEHHSGVTGADAFAFYETYGYPRELTEELLAEQGLTMSKLHTRYNGACERLPHDRRAYGRQPWQRRTPGPGGAYREQLTR